MSLVELLHNFCPWSISGEMSAVEVALRNLLQDNRAITNFERTNGGRITHQSNKDSQ